MRARKAEYSLVEGLEAETFANEPLAPQTSVRVGGSAQLLVRPGSLAALVELLRRMREAGTPLTVLGGGANTLVGDGGVAGVTVKLPSDLFPEEIEQTGDAARITVGAGAAIARLVLLMKRNRRVGAEFLAGIPGTLGGAVRMNAGTKMGECMSRVEAVEIATADGAGFIDRDALTVRYRHTELPEGGVVTRVRFRLPEGDLVSSQTAMDADLGYRKRTQPLSQPNFGSVFQNPPGDHAGRLLEAAGLKGAQEGGAQVSMLHANWIVNTGRARAQDVLRLMDRMRETVQKQFGVHLVAEVQRAGRFE